MPEQLKLWFAYPMIYWNKPEEKRLIEIIKEKIPEYHLETANTPEHDLNYNLWKRNGNGQDYYFQIVLPKMDAGIFLAFPDKMFGAGAFSEAEFLDKNGKSILEINLEGIIVQMEINPIRRLSIEETRRRYKDLL